MQTRFVDSTPTLLRLLLLFGLVGSVGCGNSDGFERVDVEGKVTLKGKALENAKVTFHPDEGTDGVGGSGMTDEEGHFEITYARGGDGIPAGKYKVTVSKRVMPDGSPAPEDVEEMDSPAKEMLPSKFHQVERTRMTADVTENGGPYNFDLK